MFRDGVEHYLVHIMREHEDFLPELDFVLELNGEVIGNVMYTKGDDYLDEDGNKKGDFDLWPATASNQNNQRQGYGKKLMSILLNVRQNWAMMWL